MQTPRLTRSPANVSSCARIQLIIAACVLVSGCASLNPSDWFLPRGMVFTTGCAPVACDTVPLRLEEPGLHTRVILIGDAGDPWNRRDHTRHAPVLNALEAWVRLRPELTTVVFLGDNVYTRGLVPGDTIAAAKLDRQLRLFNPAWNPHPPRGVFVPGNHDWYTSRNPSAALAGLRAQENRIEDLGPHMRYLPGDGCPGPDTLTVGLVRLIALDTQFWLRNSLPDSLLAQEARCGRRPEAAGRGRDSVAVTQRLRAYLESARHDDSVFSIVVSHHPLNTHGEHGARRVHSAVKEIVNGPFRREHYISQDLQTTRYRNLIEQFKSILAQTGASRPLIWAAGHDHLMELVDGTQHPPFAVNYYIVSGHGSPGHSSGILLDPEPKNRPLFWSATKPGFMVVDFLDQAHGRQIFLRVIHYDEPWRPVYYRRLWPRTPTPDRHQPATSR